MPRVRSIVVVLGTLLSAAAMALGGEIASAEPNDGSLGYGFGAQLAQPFYEVGSQATASVFFFNLSGQDAFGFDDPIGGEGCSFFVNIVDAWGRLVRRPHVPCPLVGRMPIGPFPFPFPAGTFHRFDVPLPLFYASSETGDPDGAPLPGGLYTLKAIQFFGGPGPGEGNFPGPGGNPEAQVPFRIFQCSAPGGPLPIRELSGGLFSGYRAGDPTFSGEDLVLRTAEAGLRFWRQHAAIFFPPPPPPAVDFTQEMVLVSSLGPRRDGEASVRITSVEEKPCHLEVTVREIRAPVFLPVLTAPIDIVAVPRSLKEVVFVRQLVYLPSAP